MAPDTRPNIDIEDTDDEPLDDFEGQCGFIKMRQGT